MNVKVELFSRPDLSIVVPVHNEESCLPVFYKRLTAVLAPLSITVECLFINDGSTDRSIAVLEHLRDHDASIGIISLSRCFGKEYAVSAGLKHATGEAVVVIDADLQDPPESIPKMIEAWQEGFDVVAMRRIDRSQDSWFKQVSARCFYSLFNAMSDIDIPANVGDFRLMSRTVVESINSLPESNRCMKGLFSWVGFKTKILEFDRPIRVAGTTKWHLFGLVELALDAICSFSIKPLRMATFAGSLCAAFAVMYGLYTIGKTLIFGEPVAGYTTLLTFIIFLGGTQLLAIGILGEYVGRTFIESKNRPLFLIQSFNPPYQRVNERINEKFLHQNASTRKKSVVQ